jgi:hypothetical protein
MDEQTQEVYERIPWETLEQRGKDKQWVMMGVAAAIVAGSLGFTFMSNRSIPPPSSVATVTDPGSPPPSTVAPAPPLAPPPETVPSVVAEADLYAVDPERLMSAAAAHARWVIREYLAHDGSSDEKAILRSLLPADVPLPSLPEGVLVFVEWVDSVSVEEIDVGTYRVDVLARYMIATDGGDYQRVDPELFSVEIGVTDGQPHLLSAPSVTVAETVVTDGVGLDAVPEGVAASVEALRPGSQIIGGRVDGNGVWKVVVLTAGPGGVLRPETIAVGA